MKFIARLITERELERSVQKFAPDQVNAEGLAREYLQANGCVPGDRMAVIETREVIVAMVAYIGDGDDGKPVVVNI